MASVASAKKIYAAKVCKHYLGIPEAGCNETWDQHEAHLKSGSEDA